MKFQIITLASTLGFMTLCWFSSYPGARPARPEREMKPNVKLTLATGSEILSWGSQVRYTIRVRDQEDGNSKYGEIAAHKVFLSTRFFPNESGLPGAVSQKRESGFADRAGLRLMGKTSCFNCHADEQGITGPSFSEIATSYNKETTKDKLVQSIRKGSSGRWGTMAMPAHPQLSEEEAAEIVQYILRQGACKSCGVYVGLEGVFRVDRKPPNVASGVYLLTASYTSSSGKRGADSVMITIKGTGQN